MSHTGNKYKKGDYLAICDRCGFEFFASELKKEWTGLMVCKKDWEPRHPQDFLKGKEERSNKLPWTRPEPTDQFTSVTYMDTYPDGTPVL